MGRQLESARHKPVECLGANQVAADVCCARAVGCQPEGIRRDGAACLHPSVPQHISNAGVPGRSLSDGPARQPPVLAVNAEGASDAHAGDERRIDRREPPEVRGEVLKQPLDRSIGFDDGRFRSFGGRCWSRRLQCKRRGEEPG